MFCKKCGAEIPDGSLVCPSCGNSINQGKQSIAKKLFASLGVGLIGIIIGLIGTIASGYFGFQLTLLGINSLGSIFTQLSNAGSSDYITAQGMLTIFYAVACLLAGCFLLELSWECIKELKNAYNAFKESSK